MTTRLVLGGALALRRSNYKRGRRYAIPLSPGQLLLVGVATATSPAGFSVGATAVAMGARIQFGGGLCRNGRQRHAD